MFNINIKTTKKCAICKYWYDPCNNSIIPRNPKNNLWTIDDKCSKKLCLKNNYKVNPMTYCEQYECKLEIQ